MMSYHIFSIARISLGCVVALLSGRGRRCAMMKFVCPCTSPFFQQISILAHLSSKGIFIASMHTRSHVPNIFPRRIDAPNRKGDADEDGGGAEGSTVEFCDAFCEGGFLRVRECGRYAVDFACGHLAADGDIGWWWWWGEKRAPGYHRRRDLILRRWMLRGEGAV